ncbi:MAG: orotidine 5'-phosphate decarboxylase / HUMPS family protein [Patescibacteria group bacterium]
MMNKNKSKLDHKKRYLQVALNNTLEEARSIIEQLPPDNRILIEAGTPLIKQYGEEGIRKIVYWWSEKLYGRFTINPRFALSSLSHPLQLQNEITEIPYIIADLKTMDRGSTEVEMAARAGASAAVALGNAPVETLNAFIDTCQSLGLDAMVDMMNVEFPLTVLRALKKIPPVVILHRGVDEERINRQKMLPLHEIRRIKGNYDVLIAVAGGDTLREAQSVIFNDADIVVVWKSVFQSTEETASLVEGFLKVIK